MKMGQMGRGVVLAVAVVSAESHAQVVTDGTISSGGKVIIRPSVPDFPVSGRVYEIPANAGKSAGKNLFHSFSRFDIPKNQAAQFLSPADTANIIARITGGGASRIDGVVFSESPGASLFLVNPAGMIFGPDARVFVGGEFTVTTAQALKFEDGLELRVYDRDPVLSSAPVSAFGFLADRPAGITVGSHTAYRSDGINNLADFSRSVSLVGGDVSIRRQQLTVSNGRIAIVSASKKTDVPADASKANAVAVSDPSRRGAIDIDDVSLSTFGFDGPGGRIDLVGGDVRVARSAVTSNADVGAAGVVRIDAAGTLSVEGETQIFSNGDTAGMIEIRAGSMLLRDARINARTRGAGDGGAIDVAVAGELRSLRGQVAAFVDEDATGRGAAVRVRAGSYHAAGHDDEFGGVQTVTFGAGRAGSVSVTAGGTLTLLDGSRIASDTRSTGASGELAVSAGDIMIDRQGGDFTTAIGNTSLRGDSPVGGPSSDTTITTDELLIRHGGSIDVFTQTTGDSGDLTIRARRITLDGDGWDGFTGIGTNSQLEAAAGTGGRGGAMTIEAQTITIDRGAQVSARTFGAGDAGSVKLTAARSLLLRDGGSIRASTGENGAGDANLDATGRGGRIDIVTPDLRMESGSFIRSEALGRGDAGTLQIDAHRLVIDGGDERTRISTAVGPLAFGNAGAIAIDADEVMLLRGGRVVADTYGFGRGGELQVSAGRIYLDGMGASERTGFAANSEQLIGGRAGSLRIAADDLVIRDGATIDAVTLGTGDAGDLLINARTMLIDGGAFGAAGLGAETQGRLLGQPPGRGGDVVVNADTLHVTGGGFISSAATVGGEGDAGDVSLTLARSLAVDRGGAVTTEAPVGGGGNIRITAGDSIAVRGGFVVAAAGADGGNVTLLAPNRIDLIDSVVTASAGGTGGNIFIDPEFVVLADTRISADAVAGNGGNITLRADNLLQDDTRITADSQQGLAGNIQVLSPELDLSGQLVTLETVLADPAARLRESCLAVLQDVSSFITSGRGGVPPEPGGWLASPVGEDKESQMDTDERR